jgi:hypothetical protein
MKKSTLKQYQNFTRRKIRTLDAITSAQYDYIPKDKSKNKKMNCNNILPTKHKNQPGFIFFGSHFCVRKYCPGDKCRMFSKSESDVLMILTPSAVQGDLFVSDIDLQWLFINGGV